MSKVVVGGGLAGLSAAHYLTTKSPKQVITLIEKSSRTGGWVKSNYLENGNLFEQGPRTIRPRGEAAQNTLKLIEELNLENQIVPIVSSHPVAKNRLIFANGSLHLLPNNIFGLFKKQKPFSKPLITYLLNDLKVQRKEVQDESIYEFVERRFDKEMADYLISPMICGICAGNAKEISVKFLFETFFRYEQDYGSVANGLVKNIFKSSQKESMSRLCQRAIDEKWSIFSFKNGCETLPLEITKHLLKNKNVDVKLNTQCKTIKFKNNKEVVLTIDDEEIITDHVISALPSKILGNLVQEQHPELGALLEKLTCSVSVAVVNLHFKNNLLKDPAFGLLVAPKENLPILGIIYDSCCFPNAQGDTILTVMMGGYWFKKYFGDNPSEEMILDTAIHQVKGILNIGEKPANFKVNILKDCIPQYIVGHRDCLNNINNYLKSNDLPLSLCGSSYNGVGINDVILSARKAVENVN